MKFTYPKESVQAILDYLATRPYREVFELIQLLLQPVCGECEDGLNQVCGTKEQEEGDNECVEAIGPADW